MQPPQTHSILRRALAVAAVAGLAIGGATAANGQAVTGGPNGTSTLAGVQDDKAIQLNPEARFRAIAEAGGRIARIDLRWDYVAKGRPADGTNPDDPAYDWSVYDEAVKASRKYKVQVLFTVWGTPAWAVDTSRYSEGDRSYGDYTFPPKQMSDFEDFATAAGKRYIKLGVRRWEGWNEPNVPMFLQPQFRKVGSRYVAQSPGIYSDLQKAFYKGIKRANKSAIVAGVVTSPSGDGPKAKKPVRVTPQNFVKALNAKNLRPPMDRVAHHPYPLRKRTDKPTPPNRSYADIYNLDDFTRAVDGTYLKNKRLWLTEYGFATSKTPEYPQVVSVAEQANSINDAYARFERNPRVEMAVYYLLQDHKGWRSGIVSMAGKRKASYHAHALPLWNRRVGDYRYLVGQVRPAVGKTKVTIQVLTRGKWRFARSVNTSPDGSFRLTVNSARRVPTRAIWRGKTRANKTALYVSRPISAGRR